MVLANGLELKMVLEKEEEEDQEKQEREVMVTVSALGSFLLSVNLTWTMQLEPGERINLATLVTL